MVASLENIMKSATSSSDALTRLNDYCRQEGLIDRNSIGHWYASGYYCGRWNPTHNVDTISPTDSHRDAWQMGYEDAQGDHDIS